MGRVGWVVGLGAVGHAPIIEIGLWETCAWENRFEGRQVPGTF